jgi:hypothetical protein
VERIKSGVSLQCNSPGQEQAARIGSDDIIAPSGDEVTGIQALEHRAHCQWHRTRSNGVSSSIDAMAPRRGKAACVMREGLPERHHDPQPDLPRAIPASPARPSG